MFVVDFSQSADLVFFLLRPTISWMRFWGQNPDLRTTFLYTTSPSPVSFSEVNPIGSGSDLYTYFEKYLP